MTEVEKLPRKKTDKADWLTSQEAAEIASANSGHTVSPDYIRLLGRQGKLEVWKVGKRVNLYKRAEVEALKVEQYNKDK